ncbi:MAG TPA: NAD(P)H-binding protein [Chitinophagaceae bacterium]|jgi:uncharacterized protein YbjT (DUF2867 family)|nr:NAD(P)H-binding protein [Chitinophagaceae bacterium]
MSTITILGATGKVGSKPVNNLLDKGHTLRLIARHADKLQQFSIKQGVEVYAGDSFDSDFLARVIKGSDVAFLMMPTGLQAENTGAFQDKMGNAQIEAIKKSGVKKVLYLSSVGGHTEEHVGIVAGLARQEIRLKQLENVDVLILRPSYFMENLLNNIPIIKNMGINGSTLLPEKHFPIIATADIAKVAAEKLNDPSWTGKGVLPLLGPKDYNMNEVTKALGAAISKPDLPYAQFSNEQAKQGMLQGGISESVADAFITMAEGINLGYFNTEKRDATSTTPTPIEEFAKTFAHVYNLS